jgi:flavin reductase (DIM6/NTAB) family NADH-FMN oxidoreductase RutF
VARPGASTFTAAIFTVARPNAPLTATPDDYIDAMRLLPAGVTIVTAGSRGRRCGFTATAVCSVAAEPPHLLVCANRAMQTHEIIEATGHFAVNLLHAGDAALADRFGGRTGIEGEERFFGRRWTTFVSGAPVLTDACAVFDCVLVERLAVATHDVMVGRVLEVRRSGDETALVYVDRDYGRVMPAGGRSG